MNDDISGWNDWNKAFADWTDVSISELHGLMTGLMTVCHAPNNIEDWERLLSELSFSIPDEAALTLLAEEAEDTSFQLKDKDDAYQYSPLVPDDEHDLYERVIALKQWANGFMTGFGVTDSVLTAEENSMFADLAKIGAIRIEPDDEFEGGEESYLYLYEFVRMVPVSLAIRPRKPLMSLPLIAGLAINAKTAKELEEEGLKPKTMPPVIDVMNKNNPS
ncbi:UPF0149 family protein [Psychrobacter lutiphocae]|uniref:UPF0149 family protein n=1 Tax=Psychrobacter lutiphocae TaxID=540500 RepID=UPI00036679F5|nr:UPF0149 family protein [Psychrobacter lutiphocae]